MSKKKPAKKVMGVDSVAHTALIMRTVRPGYETEVSKYVVSMVRRAAKEALLAGRESGLHLRSGNTDASYEIEQEIMTKYGIKL